MQNYLLAAVLLVGFAVSVLAAETFYIVFDATMHGCTIATAVLGLSGHQPRR